jgi:tetratricopeptide (TPR) repeat protein
MATLTVPALSIPRESIFPEHSQIHALTLTTRLAQRRDSGKALLTAMLTGRLSDLVDPALEVAAETGQPIGTVLAQCFAKEGTDELAEWLALKLIENPYRNVWPLHEIALAATRRFLDLYRARHASPSLREREILAALAHNVAWRLVALGRAAEGLPFLQEAFTLYQDLGSENQPARLQCLGTFSEALTQLGRLSEALALAEEAVAVSKVEMSPVDHEGTADAHLTFAGHLINLCGCLADVERHGDALTVIEEAVALFRRHRLDVEGQTQAFARALLCQGNELHHLGRNEEAAESLEEAITLSRDLETVRTTAFEPDLALALADLSLLYEQIGRLEDARQTLHESIERFRHLEDRYAESFRPSLAWSLSLLSPAVGRKETASVEARREAVEHYRWLAAMQPGVYEPSLGKSLFDLSESLLAAGEPRAALQASNEAVGRLRRVSSNRRDLAWSLLLRGRVRGALGHRRKALADCREAISLFRQRSAQQAAFYSVDLAVALHVLSVHLHYLGYFEPAIEATREALEIYRRLAISTPQVFLEDLASCFNSLSHHLYEAGRLEESVAATRKSIKLYRKIVSQVPQATFGLAASLSNLAPRLGELGQPAKALKPAAEAVELYRREESFPEGLATALHALGTVLADLGRPAEAAPHLEEAIQIRQRLAASQPRLYDVDLACSLVSLGKCFSDRGRYREALSKTRHGIRLLRRTVKRGDDFLRPRLAAALSNQAHQLRKLKNPQAALTAAAEAVELLKPFFLENPEYYEGWTTLALRHYLGAAEEARMEPDLGKIGDVIAAFARENR